MNGQQQLWLAGESHSSYAKANSPLLVLVYFISLSRRECHD
jgi:hypothetical protein